MPPSRKLFIALALLMRGSLVQSVETVTIDAAISHSPEKRYLIAGSQVLEIIRGFEGKMMLTEDLGAPDGFQVVAASGSLDDRDLYLYGRNNYYKKDLQTSNVTRLEYSNSEMKFFRHEGPDAVAWRDGRQFFFKNCFLAVYDEDGKLAKRNAKKLDLPCKPDAAWSNGDKSIIIILKEDQIWMWDYREKIDGPYLFSDLYFLTSWKLKSSAGENPSAPLSQPPTTTPSGPENPPTPPPPTTTPSGAGNPLTLPWTTPSGVGNPPTPP